MADEEIYKQKRKLDEVPLTPPETNEPEELFALLKKYILRYHPSTDLGQVEKAYHIAKEAHKDQKRKSGEPYIMHPLCVAIILAQLELDKETIIAGILHDVIEDTAVSPEELTKEFGEEICLLVDGVTKLTQLNYEHDKIEIQAENLRKMFLAMAKDIRVILIKLADRLHNMRTMQYQTPEKQIEKSRETMEIYSPIAQRLGISKVKVELDDLSLMYLQPEAYHQLEHDLKLGKEAREEFVRDIVAEVKQHIDEAEIACSIDGRVKHFFSIYKKMVNQNKTLDQIYDLFAVRIIVDTIKDCYAALGVIHEMYKPIPGRFKDYIAMPKPNMYQSLHTTLISSTGQPFEIQIRTYEMHRTAEYGIAAHWKYKENVDGTKPDGSEEAKLTWLRQILEWQRDMSDNKEFLSVIKSDLDLFSDNVYCFTPQGDVKNLPAGSTPIDFAYSIHSAVGNKMVGAKVNGKLVTIDYQIKNGDRIEVITSQNSKGPSRDWLAIVKSPQARSKINAWFKSELKEENIIRGKELIAAYAKGHGLQLGEMTKPEFTAKVLLKYGFHDWESVLAAVGHGGLKESQVVNKLQEEYEKKQRENITDAQVLSQIADDNDESGESRPKRSGNKGGIIVKGVHDLSVHFSKCCSPVPGDEITGFVTRGRGISIHRTDCVNVINMSDMDRHRLIEAEWAALDATGQGEKYTAEIKIYANNRTGLIVDVSKILTERKIEIKAMNCKTNKQGRATLELAFDISGVAELTEIVSKIRGIEGIIDIERTAG